MPKKNKINADTKIQTRFWLIALCLLALLLSACDVQSPPLQTTPTPSSTLKPILDEVYTPEPTPLPPSATPTATFTATLPPTATPTPKTIAAELVPITQIQLKSPHYAWGSDLQQRRVFRSEDSGTTWKEVTPPDSANGDYYSGATMFLGANEAWLLVSKSDETSVLFHTTDAGVSWDKVELAFPGGQMSFIRVEGAKAATGVIMADLGVGAGSQWVALYATSDSGKTWTQTFTHTPGEGDASLPAGGIKSSMTYDGKNDLWITGSVPVDNFLY
ncbi:MAG: YCF48-related protein, partial [Anaerolineaceae bacterium]